MDHLSLTTTQSAGQKRDWPSDKAPLLKLGPNGENGAPMPENYWSLSDAFQGVQIFGGTGSGKTSGSGQALARAFLRNNFGGLVLTAKTDEVGAWKRYAADTGRGGDLLIVDHTAKWRFNFLDYETSRTGVGAGHTENLVNLFCTVLEASERRHGQGGGSDAYWQRTLKQLLRNAVDLVVLSGTKMSLPAIYQIISSAPRSDAEVEDSKWKGTSACFKAIAAAKQKAVKLERTDDFELVVAYWLREFPGLAIETRSVIVSTFTSMADCFLRGLLRKLFCSDRNFGPEQSFAGRIIILNLPVKEFNEMGQFAQVLFKYVWQRAVERRIPQDTDRATSMETVRPVFLWADESQFFANSYDALFQSTARSSRASTVYLTQNLPSYFASFGGANSRSEVEAFVGNLQTKIFHANGDPTTNNWAADSIGRTRQIRFYSGMSEALGRQGGGGLNQNAGGSEAVEYLVQPQEFTMLKTGGEDCEMQVDGVIFQAGRRWRSDSRDPKKLMNHVRQTFPQSYRQTTP